MLNYIGGIDLLFNLIEKGGFVMYPLIALSLLSLAVITERCIFWLRIMAGRDQNLVLNMLSLSEKEEYEDAIDMAVDTRDFLACVLLNGLRHRYYSLKLALETQAHIELKFMKRNMTMLDTIITAAPLLGILGTVVGIISSFNLLGGQTIPDPSAVTAGISQALITTAYGLSISIITIFPYNYFSSKCKYAVSDMEKYSSMLEMLFDKNRKEKQNNAVRENK